MFICTGNICRSPIAERLAMAYAQETGMRDLAVSSAGTRAVVGRAMDDSAAEVLRGLGGDPERFISRQFTPHLGGSADLIVTMTKSHRDSVLERAPRLLNRTYSLGEVAAIVNEFEPCSVADLPRLRSRLAGRGLEEVADPVGQDQEFFAAVGSQIASLVPSVLAIIGRGRT